MFNPSKQNIFIATFLLVFLPISVMGAVVGLDSDQVELGVGSEFEVVISLDSEKVSANAISGRIIFDPKILQLKTINEGGSAINFWIEKPNLIEPGVVSFSGITPLGFPLGKNVVFSLIFTSAAPGEAEVRFADLELLKNDGQGTLISVKKQSTNFLVKADLEPILVDKEESDREPPEIFRPELGQDPEIFDGQYFLVFMTEDKGVGILHYEVKEGRFGDFVETNSPYLIKDQSLRKDIYVKVIDRAYNERIVKFESRIAWYKDYYLLGIIGLLGILLTLFLRRKWKRKYTNY